MAVRLTVMLSLIGCMVWLPEQTKAAGLGRFAQFAGLAGCLMCFFSTFSVGGVLNTASAGISGCFVACFNIWLLRGFFPDGVTPGMGFTSAPSLVGWVDLAICVSSDGSLLWSKLRSFEAHFRLSLSDYCLLPSSCRLFTSITVLAQSILVHFI